MTRRARPRGFLRGLRATLTSSAARRAVAVLLLGATAPGCRTVEPAPQPAERSPEQEARELVEQARRDVEKGEAQPISSAGGAELFLPSRGERVPLLVFLHGLGGSGRELAAALSLDAMSESAGFAYIAPDGMLDHAGRRFWNATDSCCNFEGLSVDHVGELRGWIEAATRHARIDARRVYLVGFSNGGFLAYRAACEIGHLLAGIVSIAGAGPGDTRACHPEKKLSVVQIHGDADPIVKFEGGHLFADRRRPRHPSAEKSLAYWAKYDACSGDAVPTRHLDLDPGLPGAETEVRSYPGCSGRRVELWRIPAGNHTVGLSRLSVQAVVDFIDTDTTTP
jgi:polyhydroxybutyrate depolymerase